VPLINPEKKRDRIILEGDVPSPIHPPSGCSFHPRCRYREEICRENIPVMEEFEENHWVRCYFPRK